MRTPHQVHQPGQGQGRAGRAAQIFTGADLAEAKVGGLPCGWLITSIDGTPMKEPAHPVLAQGKVRHVGDQVAWWWPTPTCRRKDAAELIEVDYESCRRWSTSPRPKAPEPAVHDDVPGQRLLRLGPSATRPRWTRPSPRRRTSRR
jgi:aerobic carbon-monoxide dehydrogenase large subunit